jgi:hypothetical protein
MSEVVRELCELAGTYLNLGAAELAAATLRDRRISADRSYSSVGFEGDRVLTPVCW